MSAQSFQGFPEGILDFFEKLRANNNKDWFDAHRDRFDDEVLNPAKAFVESMGRRLLVIAPHIHAEPRMNGSIFRIYRDVRFSKDKTPYKSHLAIWLWEGSSRKGDSAGFYLHLEPGNLSLGAGIYRFDKNQMNRYRKAVDEPSSGERLSSIIESVGSKEGFGIGGELYKKVPRGYDPDHPRGGLLKRKGLYAHTRSEPPHLVHTPELLDYCFERYHAMLPLHKWLLESVV